MWQHDRLDEVQKKLLDQNIIAIGGDIDSDMALYVREALLRLIGRGSPEIKIFITSGGGSLDASLGIYDGLRTYSGKTTGIVYGYAHSIAVIILQACKKRVGMRHSLFLIHNIRTQEIDLDILCDPKKIAKFRDKLAKAQGMIYQILAQRTNQTIRKIKVKCSQDKVMTAEEALEFGLIDEII